MAYGKVGQSIKQIPFENFHANEPAGAFISSVNDMSNWMIAWLNGGKFEGIQVILSDYVEKATQLQNIMPQQGTDAQVFGDGYDWRLNANKGHSKVHHGGNTPDFSAQLTTYPEQRIGIIALTNQTSSILSQLVIDMLTNELFGLE